MPNKLVAIIIGGANLSQDIIDALNGAAAPSGANVFATMADIAASTHKDAYVLNGDVSSSFIIPTNAAYQPTGFEVVVDMSEVAIATGVALINIITAGSGTYDLEITEDGVQKGEILALNTVGIKAIVLAGFSLAGNRTLALNARKSGGSMSRLNLATVHHG